jgi:alanine dehydrogenase
MRFVTDEEVASALSMREVIEAVERGFALYSLRKVRMTQRVRTDVPEHNGAILLMPCQVPELEVYSVKYVTVYPDNPSRGLPTIFAAMLISDPRTGEPKILAEARAATGMRTGAATAVSIKYLARRDSEELGIIGCGYQARWQLRAAVEVMRCTVVRAYSRTRQRAEEFAAEMSRELGLDVKVTETVDELVRRSDVVITATTSKTPFVRREWVRPGTHFSAIGAFTPDMAELSADLVASSKVYVDSLEAAKEEAGDVIQAVAKGLMRWEDVKGEIGEVVAGLKKGREGEEEVTVFKSVGIAVQDAAVASLLLRRFGG